MKKLLCLMVVLLMCLGFAAPVYAAEDTFVPSISEKDGPEIVPGKDDEGKPTIGRVLDENGEVIDYIYEGCLVITPVSKANVSKEIPVDAKELLLSVYDQLKSGTMQIPYEKISSTLDPSKMVIRELVDISWLCDEHPELVEPKGVTIELTFDMGVKADTDVYVMSYKNNEWGTVVKTVNNGDGTITCEFEDFCPVSFSVRKGSETPPPQTGDNTDLTLWIALMVVSFAGIAAVFFFYRKTARKSN